MNNNSMNNDNKQTQLQEFKNTFLMLMEELTKIIDTNKKNKINQFNYYMLISTDYNIISKFYDNANPYQEDILTKNDKFIKQLTIKFPILEQYHVMSTHNKNMVLEYLKTLYLRAYQYFNT